MDWLPDETVFSLCARFGVRKGHRHPAETTLDLFGHHQIGAAHDFPCRLDRLVTRFEGRLGSSETILRDHSIVPFFFPFSTFERCEQIVKTLKGDRVGLLRFAMGLLTSRFRSAHPLKACSKCMEQDVKLYRVAYWHTAHQLPGVWWCFEHDCALWASRRKINNVHRYAYMLPAGEDLSAGVVDSVQGREVLESLTRLASTARRIWSQPANAIFLPEHVSKAYSWKLESLGLTPPRRQRPRYETASEAFFQHSRYLKILPDVSMVPEDIDGARRWIQWMVYTPRSGAHPLRHAITITWLFGSFDEFIDYNALAARGGSPAKSQSSPVVEEAIKAPESGTAEARLVALVRQGHSISASSLMVGVTPSTGLSWAGRNGLEIRRKPQKMTESTRAKIEAMARAGASTQAIADATALCNASICNAIRSIPGLNVARQETSSRISRDQRRRGWSALVAANPGLTIKRLRMMDQGAYAWLYVHDRAWLNGALPSGKVRQEARPSIDWDVRDRELAKKVERAALELIEVLGGRKLRLVHLCERVHELSTRRCQLGRLPLTARALERALGRAMRNEGAPLL